MTKLTATDFHLQGVWQPKSIFPIHSDRMLTGGYFYVRGGGENKLSIRYFEDTNNCWHLPTNEGFHPNNSFDEWLRLIGVVTNEFR